MSDLAMYDVVEKEKVQYIVVKIGGEHYGIDISYIDNIVRMSKITRVPKSPSYYRGVINLRGEVVPVMSLRRRMNLEDDEFTDASRIIILKLDSGGLMGVIVDEVKEVLTLGHKAGLQMIMWGLESGSKKVLELINKGIDLDRRFEILENAMNNPLKQENIQNGKIEIRDIALLNAPVAVVGAFSCELFLKAFLPTGIKGQHGLKDYFNMLDINDQTVIKEKTVESTKKYNANYTETEFNNDLDINSKTFSNWRYFHEENKVGIKVNHIFISCFLKALFQYIQEERQKLQQFSQKEAD